MPNLGPIEICELNILYERTFSKLSENHKSFENGQTELKLWPIKGRAVLQRLKLMLLSTVVQLYSYQHCVRVYVQR